MGPLNNNNKNRTKTLSPLTLPKLLQIASVLITVFGTPEMLLYTIVPARMPKHYLWAATLRYQADAVIFHDQLNPRDVNVSRSWAGRRHLFNIHGILNDVWIHNKLVETHRVCKLNPRKFMGAGP